MNTSKNVLRTKLVVCLNHACSVEYMTSSSHLDYFRFRRLRGVSGTRHCFTILRSVQPRKTVVLCKLPSTDRRKRARTHPAGQKYGVKARSKSYAFSQTYMRTRLYVYTQKNVLSSGIIVAILTRKIDF